jgi:CubicO group peptidase (beta-lactamase class C family)
MKKSHFIDKKRMALMNALFNAAVLATACGGGGGDAKPPVTTTPVPSAPTIQERTRAATQTANTNLACNSSALPEGFYWEIGDRNGSLASGIVNGTNTPAATQVIAIASSSKWIYSTYVLQKLGSTRPSDVPFLHFTSGYVFPPLKATKEVLCGLTETVGECAADVVQSPSAKDNFFYSAGHFQYHAANVMGLGSLGAQALTTEITSQVGNFDFTYLQTNLAGGLNASANGYAAFLRRMLRGEYVMSSQLGSNKVCGSAACAAGLVLSPAPSNEAWNYSLGHWVEDDPMVGDHAFSSAGALGFYPWIDSSKSWYGVLARRAANPGGSQGIVSLSCGRLIRQAWATGVTVSGMTPTPYSTK